MVEKQLNQKVLVFQCDGGGEFTSKNFVTHLSNCGIRQMISCPHTPQQNGLAERKHRHITELGLSMLFDGKVPQKHWVEAFFTASFLGNLLPSSSLSDNRNPYEALFNKKPEYSALRIFGSACYPSLRPYASNKLDPRSLQCVFLGYNEKYKGYRCLHQPTGRVYINRHVIFDEEVQPFATTYSHLQQQNPTPLTSAWQLSFLHSATTTVPDESTGVKSKPIPVMSSWQPYLNVTPIQTVRQDNTSNEPAVTLSSPTSSGSHQKDSSAAPPTVQFGTLPAVSLQSVSSTPSGCQSTSLAKSSEQSSAKTQQSSHSQDCRNASEQGATTTQTSTASQSIHPMVTRSKAGTVKPNPRYALFTVTAEHAEPRTVTQALKHPGWNGAMTEEMVSFDETDTFTLVPYHSDMHILGCRWIFRVKLNADGTVKCLRSRLVVKGYDQAEGIDYLDTYSPVVKSPTIRAILHLATVNKWDIRQLDVNYAFLYGDLEETVYMHQPPGFINPEKPTHVCKLNKAIYGLKQAPRAWFNKFSDFLLAFGFVCSIRDPSLFIYRKGGDVMLLLLYVDDIALTGSNSGLIGTLLEELNKEFKMKDLGRFHYFLGLQAQFLSNGLFLNQERYAEDLLHISGMSECTPVATPLPLQLNRVPDESTLFSQPTYFRSLAGKLQYLTLTRPDLQFAVNYICQRMHAPTESDFLLLKRVLRYLRGTTNFGITFKSETDSAVRAYSDSDWGGCIETRRSTGGFCTFLGSNIISWSAQKQQSVSRSSTEAEYRTLSDTAAELVWLLNLLREIGIPHTTPPEVFCDNLSAVYL